MSDPSDTNQEPAAASHTDTGGLMSSIQAVREIIMMNTVSEAETIKELQTLKQSQYEDRVKMEEEIGEQKSKIAELESKLENSHQEVQREKSLRQALETSHSTLEEQKKEFITQLEAAAVARASLEEKIAEFREGLEKEEASFTKERGQWEELVAAIRLQRENALIKTGTLEATLLTFQRRAKELEDELSSLKEQIESTRTRQEETIQGYVNSNERLKERITQGKDSDSIESLQVRLEEAEMARRQAVNKVRENFCY